MSNIGTKDLGHMLVHHQRCIEWWKDLEWAAQYHRDMVVAIAAELLIRYRKESELLRK